jgi:hypothetical protein
MSDVPPLYHERADSTSLSIPSSLELPYTAHDARTEEQDQDQPEAVPTISEFDLQLLKSARRLRADLDRTNDVVGCQKLVDAFLTKCGLGAALGDETAVELKMWRRRRRVRESSSDGP